MHLSLTVGSRGIGVFWVVIWGPAAGRNRQITAAPKALGIAMECDLVVWSVLPSALSRWIRPLLGAKTIAFARGSGLTFPENSSIP